MSQRANNLQANVLTLKAPVKASTLANKIPKSIVSQMETEINLKTVES